MEISYSTLKTKEVINVNDGHCLGKTKDIVFTYPEGKILGIVVPGVGGFRFFNKSELFIDLRCIVKIGDDVVLADVKGKTPPPPKPICPPKEPRRNYDEYE